MQLALAAQDAVIDALAERTEVLRNTLWEMAPKRMLKNKNRVENQRLFFDLNFGNELLECVVATEIPE